MKPFISAVFITFLLFETSAWAVQKNTFDWTFVQLDYARKEKVNHLKRYTERLHSFAKQAAKDKRISAFFEMNRQYFNAMKDQEIPESLSTDVSKLRKQFDQYYLSSYFVFYDIIFINNDGLAFHTIRKELDTHVNLINEKASIGKLGEVISRKPDHEVFIDFYHYPPSSEPAAFFVEPILNEGVQVGWIALQCAINKLNTIFVSTDELGKTGETFLINQNGLMLTESYFKGYSTILKLHLDERNIQPKFKNEFGHRIVTDYRGATALSSFEVFEFLGSKWLVIAQIDKNEILTEHYKCYHKYYRDQILEYIHQNPLALTTFLQEKQYDKTVRVDIDEFLKAEQGEVLETWGVSTCTALIATIPERFSYLAHISPKDKMYNGDETDLLEQITKKIKGFDVYPCERQDVLFIVAAPHLESIPNIIDQLIEEGFFLSQIRIAYNPAAKSATILSDYKTDNIIIKWMTPEDKNEIIVTGIDETYNINAIIEKMMFGM
ncbi:MAG: cache domain-containing protein [Desulfotignum sp.]|nr:cache domain-containing protein [Desulfotignum sp.]MCF8138504.1 cache domain-containing protein [Desulfotignum sp.]